ncbi:MAG: hypothetical protein V4819_02590 [Verrucomicrobiota bacterium]
MNTHHGFLASALLVLLTASLPAASTIDSTNKFAYAANAGWINFRHDQPSSPNGIVFGDYFLSGYAYGANIGWIHFGDGTPDNLIQYQNNSASNCGVNHDGSGNLSGYAYGANIGWINFGWTTIGNENRPRVNLLTGAFSGYAYSANIGWINLGTGYLITNTMTLTDTDADGIADAWELTYFGVLTTATAATDFDKDGATDKNEYLSGTTPNNSNDYFKIVSSTYNGTHTQATVVFTTTASRLYRLETSNALGASPDVWTNSAFGTFAPDTGATTSRIISWPGTAKKFIRAAAVIPLQ